jgi:chaperonin GroES
MEFLMSSEVEIFRPMQDRVLVRRLNGEAVTTGGIHIPEQHRERPNWGEVVSVGTGRVTEAGNSVPVAVSVGAKVLFGKYSGTEISIDKQEFLILREDEILGWVARHGDVLSVPQADGHG